MPVPIVRARSTAFSRNASREGRRVFAIQDAVPGIVILSSRVSTELTNAQDMVHACSTESVVIRKDACLWSCGRDRVTQ